MGVPKLSFHFPLISPFLFAEWLKTPRLPIEYYVYIQRVLSQLSYGDTSLNMVGFNLQFREVRFIPNGKNSERNF